MSKGKVFAAIIVGAFLGLALGTGVVYAVAQNYDVLDYIKFAGATNTISVRGHTLGTAPQIISYLSGVERVQVDSPQVTLMSSDGTARPRVDVLSNAIKLSGGTGGTNSGYILSTARNSTFWILRDVLTTAWDSVVMSSNADTTYPNKDYAEVFLDDTGIGSLSSVHSASGVLTLNSSVDVYPNGDVVITLGS